MKNLYIVILIICCSCAQNTKESKEIKETIVKAKNVDAEAAVTNAVEKLSTIESFTKAFKNLPTKSVPLVDKTNFDMYIEQEDHKNIASDALKLPMIYPNLYKEGFNYRAIDGYAITLSEQFYTVVITILKGDNEMETRLINYNLQGDIIDSKVIAYDEIAEGMFSKNSKIEQDKITIHYIELTDEKRQETEMYRIKPNGKLMLISAEESMVDNVIHQLGLKNKKIKTDLLTHVTFGDTKESIIIIPEIADEAEEIFELNSHIVIYNTTTNQITHTYFESFKTNGWTSDAIRLDEIKIDTAPYYVDKNTRAFGIRVNYFGSSRVNPYYNQTLSLFIKDNNTLKKVLHNFSVEKSTGELDDACSGQFLAEAKILIMANEKTNSYFDIVVKNKITKTKDFENENGECDSKEASTTDMSLLNFNGKTYIENK